MASTDIHLKFDFSVAEMEQKVKEVIAKDRQVLDEIAALDASKITEQNVLHRLSVHSARLSPVEQNLEFIQHIHPAQELRDASTQADKTLSEHSVEMEMRKDVFDVLCKLQTSVGASLSGEWKRYLDRLVKYGMRNGLHLDETKRGQIKDIKKRLREIAIDFQKNVNAENTKFEFTKEQLKGLSDDYLTSRRKGDEDVYEVFLKYPDYFPLQKKCSVPETRRVTEAAFHSRCKDLNAKLLEEAVTLRQQQADILGYKTHSDYALELRMAKNQATAADFLKDLAVKLRPSFEKEMALFLQYKTEDAKTQGYSDDGKIHMYDFRYFMTMAEEKFYSVDHEKLKEYFPVDVVTKGLLEIYQTLLHLKFEQVTSGPCWHSDVTLYKVTDSDTGMLMGYFYLDLYPRENKFNHAACFGLQCYGEFPDGTVQYPVCAMVANFPKPVGDKPALFTHDDVETFFHEFGHAMHQICSRTKIPIFAGTRVERDFVEAPSQMLENWVWQAEPLAKLSGHYKDGSAIPKELLEKLVASRKANAGIFNLRQVMLSSFDQAIHSKGQVDVAAEYELVCQEIMGVPATPDTCMPASFEHLIDGYDAQYYGYLWSEVYSADMFASRFGKEGVLNPETGLSYRKCILEPGGSRDAIDMLRQFLGREPNSQAFLVSKGLA